MLKTIFLLVLFSWTVLATTEYTTPSQACLSSIAARDLLSEGYQLVETELQEIQVGTEQSGTYYWGLVSMDFRITRHTQSGSYQDSEKVLCNIEHYLNYHLQERYRTVTINEYEEQ